MKPVVRAVTDSLAHVTVPYIEQAQYTYTTLKLYRAASEDGSYSEAASVALRENISGYQMIDTGGDSTSWYKARLEGTTDSEYSDARQAGTSCAYITAWDLRSSLYIADSGETAIGQEHEHNIWEFCQNVSRAIDNYKGVADGAYSAATSAARYYDGDGSDVCVIDPAVSVSAVAVEESTGSYTTWTLDTDVFTWPNNASAIGEPIRELRVNLKSTGTKSAFTAGQRRVQVTAVWGITASAPRAVQQAALIIASNWYKKAQGGFQESMGMPETGTMLFAKELPPEATSLLRGVYPHVS